MTSSQEAAQILDAVEAMIARERERVDDPVTGVSGGDPSDGVGWRSLRGGDKRPGSPYYNADTWRWFQLVDLAYLDDLIVVEFRWTEPTTPTDLRYLLFCPRTSRAQPPPWLALCELSCGHSLHLDGGSGSAIAGSAPTEFCYGAAMR